MITYVLLTAIVLFIGYRFWVSSKLPKVTVSEAKELKKDKQSVFLDVRTLAEWKSGHIDSAIHIPLQELASRIVELNSKKDKQIIVYCQSGGRSTSATQILLKNGFNVKNMIGGYSAWGRN